MSGSDERPAPSAIGTLEARPLVHLLVYARNRRLTGRLELHSADGHGGSITLWKGRIRDARTLPASSYFGVVAYELGLIDTATLDATLLEISKSKRLHGEVLVERGALTAAQRDSVLSEQTTRKIHQLFSLPPEATFAFYDEKPADEEPAFTLDPIKPAWLGLRVDPPVASVCEVLARFATTTLRMANEGPIAQAGLDVDEAALCEALMYQPMTLAQLRAASTLPPARVDLLAYLLIVTKCAEPGTASAASLAATRPSSANMAAAPAARPSSANMAAAPPARPSSANMAAAPPAGATPAAPAAAVTPSTAPPREVHRLSASDSGEMRRASLSFRVPSAPAIRTSSSAPSARTSAPPLAIFSPADVGAMGIAHRAAAIASEDPFSVLGLQKGASMEAARAAYFRLSKVWHPDRLAQDLAPFRIEVETIFDHMTRAHHTLTDPDARRIFEATGTASTVPSTQAAKRPRVEVLREIEAALGKRDFQSAEGASRNLMATDPDDAEAQALVAWASAFAGEGSEETLRAALTELDRAVAADRYCERAHYYRGVLQKRLGNNAAAFRDFTRVVQLNPKHVDAQREVRIFEMRARKGSGEHAIDVMIAKTKKK